MSVTISGDTGLAGAATGALNGSLGATTPSTVVATTISASGVITATGGVVVGASAAPAFSAQIGITQTVTTGVATKIQFNTEDFDTSSAYDNVTNYRFTPQVAGYYQINISLYASGSVLTQLNLYVFKNGSQTGTKSAFTNNNSAVSQCVFFSQLMFLNGSTDYIEGYGLLSGTSGNFQAGNICYFQAYLARSS